MVTRLGFVGLALCGALVLLLHEQAGICEPLRSLLLCALLSAFGGLALFRTRQVISPIFARSRFCIGSMRCMGAMALVLGLAGLASYLGRALGFW
jgi:hypothetical protein